MCLFFIASLTSLDPQDKEGILILSNPSLIQLVKALATGLGFPEGHQMFKKNLGSLTMSPFQEYNLLS